MEGMPAYSHHGLCMALVFSPDHLQLWENVPIVKSQEMETKINTEIFRKKLCLFAVA